MTEVSRPLAVDTDQSDSLFSIEFERYWRQARNSRYWLLGFFVAAVLLGLLVTLLMRPIYRSEAVIEISPVSFNITNLSETDVQETQADDLYFQTQIELLDSRAVALNVVKSLNLTASPDFRSAFDLEDVPNFTRRDAAEILLRNVTISPVPMSNLVGVRFVSPDAKLSAEIANGWADQFLDMNYMKRFGANIDARKYLAQQIESMRMQLADSERELVNYANANDIIILEPSRDEGGSTSAAQSMVGSQLASLNNALSGATARRIAAQSAMNASASTADMRGLQSQLRGQLAQAQAELASLRANFGPDYPEVKSRELQVQALRQALDNAMSNNQSELRASYRQAQLEEDALRERVNAYADQFVAQQSGGIQYGILKREVDTNRELYDALLQRAKDLEAAGAGKNNMTVVQPAEVAREPYRPVLFLNLLIAAILALIVSFAFVFIREMMDSTLRDPADVQRLFDIPTLGIIPRASDRDDVVELLGTAHSELFEAYAAARTNINFLTTHGAPKNFMLTSSRPNEGKTLTGVAIARTFALLGRKVLLVDADLRHSGVNEVLGAAANDPRGLSTVLSGSAKPAEVFQRIEQFGFDLLPSGTNPPNPADLLAADNLKRLISELESQYDLIIIDGPPVLGLADALEISKTVEGVVYVLESNGLKTRAIETALNRLRSANANIFGAIVTKLDARNTSYGYGDGYGYGYGYGTPGGDEPANTL